MEILIGIVALIFVTTITVAVGERFGLPWPTLLTLVIAVPFFYLACRAWTCLRR